MHAFSHLHLDKIARPATTATGLCEGALVMTTDGELPVEFLTAGDRVITRDGAAVLRGVNARQEVVAPVRIKARSIGHNKPNHDARVTVGTRLHLRDWRAQAVYGVADANIAAGRLVDGEFLSIEPARDMMVYDLILDEDHIIYADGLELFAQAA